MEKYIMALDQGTTSSRTIIYDRKGNMISVVQREFTQIFPHEGWVEHDAMEIWASQMGTAQEALLKAVNLGQDTDTVGAIAGGLAALYYGYDAIPPEWIAELKRKEWIEELCEKADQVVGQ